MAPSLTDIRVLRPHLSGNARVRSVESVIGASQVSALRRLWSLLTATLSFTNTSVCGSDFNTKGEPTLSGVTLDHTYGGVWVRGFGGGEGGVLFRHLHGPLCQLICELYGASLTLVHFNRQKINKSEWVKKSTWWYSTPAYINGSVQTVSPNEWHKLLAAAVECWFRQCKVCLKPEGVLFVGRFDRLLNHHSMGHVITRFEGTPLVNRKLAESEHSWRGH